MGSPPPSVGRRTPSGHRRGHARSWWGVSRHILGGHPPADPRGVSASRSQDAVGRRIPLQDAVGRRIPSQDAVGRGIPVGHRRAHARWGV
ncbi:hypothetical protein T484DRAFT_1961062 [Baffinella frigidus]|nr:hypothetical protein T484DRAFT_1961062 [Cryptophyta sp. CCMP2293]